MIFQSFSKVGIKSNYERISSRMVENIHTRLPSNDFLGNVCYRLEISVAKLKMELNTKTLVFHQTLNANIRFLPEKHITLCSQH